MSIVTSKDGTPIAYDAIGSGPAVILVDGATGSRSSGYSLDSAQRLAPHFTTYAYDRRGRGESGDTQPFALEREIEDIEALIAAAGGSASLFGISSGAALALEAAIRLPGKVTKLALYEAPYDDSDDGVSAWHTYRERLTELLAQGRRDDAVALFMTFVGAPSEMIEGMRESPMWPALEAVAPTLAYDAAALGPDRTVPTERAAAVTAQTLVMDGEASVPIMPFMRASADTLARAIPGAKRRTLEGQGHNVDDAALAPVLIAFFTGEA